MARRQVYIRVLLLVMAFILVGCSGGSYKITVGDITASDNSISGNYSGFSGYYFKSITFRQGENVDFHISVQTDSGEISAKLIDTTGNIVAELDRDKQIAIKKTEKYRVQVEGEKHKGSILITWKEQNNTQK